MVQQWAHRSRRRPFDLWSCVFVVTACAALGGCSSPGTASSPSLHLWPESAHPSFCNLYLPGDEGVLYGFRATNETDGDLRVTGVDFDHLDNLAVIERSLLEPDDGALTDGYPPTFPSNEEWASRVTLGRDAVIPAGKTMRLMIGLELLGDAESGGAHDLRITVEGDAGSHDDRSSVDIEIRRAGECRTS